ncbi:hypothetical protein PROFUN_03031 [Planoprotostelium fungivorum]|uniref:Uncharacterized protein n=1 Tax=Planoprotostelium fungivorum TaxID=1890364 RepID=A0A2P6NXC7_9EUKA|nr:hypothetical protein PROFUN_03031 [Planoprotostelium fungivorum]
MEAIRNFKWTPLRILSAVLLAFFITFLVLSIVIPAQFTARADDAIDIFLTTRFTPGGILLDTKNGFTDDVVNTNGTLYRIDLSRGSESFRVTVTLKNYTASSTNPMTLDITTPAAMENVTHVYSNNSTKPSSATFELCVGSWYLNFTSVPPIYNLSITIQREDDKGDAGYCEDYFASITAGAQIGAVGLGLLFGVIAGCFFCCAAAAFVAGKPRVFPSTPYAGNNQQQPEHHVNVELEDESEYNSRL